MENVLSYWTSARKSCFSISTLASSQATSKIPKQKSKTHSHTIIQHERISNTYRFSYTHNSCLQQLDGCWMAEKIWEPSESERQKDVSKKVKEKRAKEGKNERELVYAWTSASFSFLQEYLFCDVVPHIHWENEYLASRSKNNSLSQ